MKIKNLLGAAAIMMMASQVQAAPFVIDHFVADGDDFVVDGNTKTFTTADASAVGGFRTVTLDAATNDGGTTNQLRFNSGPGSTTGDAVNISNDSGVNGIVTILWDANGSGLGGVDLTTGGNTQLTLDVLGIDLNTTVVFAINDGTFTETSTAQSFTGPGIFQYDLANFTVADYTSVEWISMTISSTVAKWDAEFDLVEIAEPLPLPAPIALVGLGFVGLGLMRRRKAG